MNITLGGGYKITLNKSFHELVSAMKKNNGGDYNEEVELIKAW